MSIFSNPHMTLQTHIMGKRKWNAQTLTTFSLLRLIFRKGDQSLKCGGFSFTSNPKTYINGDDHHVLPQRCLHCNERGHDLLNKAPMRNIITKIICNKIMCKEKKLFILKAMYDPYLTVKNIINTNACWCGLHYPHAILTILTISMAMPNRHIDYITK